MSNSVTPNSRSVSARLPQPFVFSVIALAALASAACTSHGSGASQLTTAELIAPPQGVFHFCINRQEECGLGPQETTKPDEGAKLVSEPAAEMSDDEVMILARQVNASINSAISYRTDYEQWGREETWLLPLSEEGVEYGDCEDYALEKRRELLAHGVPADRLSLATAWSELTGLHAVLIVRTSEADYVLDNATPHIARVGATNYTWRSLQTGSHLLSWARVEAPTMELQPAQVMTAG